MAFGGLALIWPIAKYPRVASWFLIPLALYNYHLGALFPPQPCDPYRACGPNIVGTWAQTAWYWTERLLIVVPLASIGRDIWGGIRRIFVRRA